MQGSKDRILTTHVGSLPRTLPVLDAMKVRFDGATFDDETYQAEIDIVTDGEISKPGFMSYVEERIDGFEARPDEKYGLYTAEVEAFPEYYADYMERTMYGAAVAKFHPIYRSRPISYKGQAALNRDLETLSAALDTVDVEGAVVPSFSPADIGANDFCKTDEEFFEAVANAIGEEYEAIVDAGFLVQIDDPFLSEILIDLAVGRCSDKEARQPRRRGSQSCDAEHRGSKNPLPHMLRDQ